MNSKTGLTQKLLRTARKLKRDLLPVDPSPDWASLLKDQTARWDQARAAARGGPKILIATSTGGHKGVTPIESLLAVALTLRGAEVHILLCDEALPACMQAMYADFSSAAEFAEHGSEPLCRSCYRHGVATYTPLGLPIYRYSQLLSADEIVQADAVARELPAAAIPAYRAHGLAVGEHALAGALRFFAMGTLEHEPESEPVLRRYLAAALRTAAAVDGLLRREEYAAVCFHHGIYVPQGVIGEVCRQRGVRVVNWSAAYRKQCFIFSHNDTYHHTLMDEPTSTWEELPWSEKMEADVLDYLRSRWHGSRDWIYFHEKPREELDQIVRELGIDFSKPTIGLLTNVVWDAQLHYPANAFPNMLEWIRATITAFADRPDLQLLIRVHPAEVRGAIPSRQPVVSEIRQMFPVLPPNVFVIPPESQISTYAAMLQCDSVIIYGTKTGVELTSLGVPVIVAGEAWIRNKGLTRDASSAAEYAEMLATLPVGRRMDAATTTRARKYAYHFFFRRMIHVACVLPGPGWPPYTIQFERLDDVMPGAVPGLDVICDGILTGSPFVYPAERLGVA
ncbi:MAG: hypothetical protein OHK0015_11740 [Chloroflexi bacterium OHK40]